MFPHRAHSSISPCLQTATKSFYLFVQNVAQVFTHKLTNSIIIIIMIILGIDSTSLASLNSSVTEPGPQTYIVAQNPEVLAHLIKENESRGGSFTPAAYTAPASVFNTIAVDFEKKTDVQPVLKTCPIPVQALQKLDPEVGLDETIVVSNTTTTTTTPTKKKATLERTASSKSGSPKMNSLERRKG